MGPAHLSRVWAGRHLKRVTLLAALAAGRQEDVQRVGSHVHLDPAGWFRGEAPTT